MKDVTDAKGLRQLHTATTRRLRAKPPQQGTAHLEMYLLSKEKQRLEQEMAHLDQRRESIHRRVTEILEDFTRLQQVAQQDEAGGVSDGSHLQTPASPAQPSPGQAERRWKTMPLEY